jgi:hypothetical protein
MLILSTSYKRRFSSEQWQTRLGIATLFSVLLRSRCGLPKGGADADILARLAVHTGSRMAAERGALEHLIDLFLQ